MNKMKMMYIEDGYVIAYLFAKKHFIKVLSGWGVKNWKRFLKTEYTSDDTEQMVSEFETKNWKCKEIVLNKISDG